MKVAKLTLLDENSQLTEQVLHSSKLAALGELAATVLHDIRGPLSMIQMVTEDLEDTLVSKDAVPRLEMEEALENIKRACERIHKLGNHLRDYARHDVQEVLEDTSVEELFKNSVFLVQQKIRNYGIQMILEVPNDVKGTRVACFPNKIEQVLMNLMYNACDAMEGSAIKNLTLRVSLETENVLFYVEDTGPGMSQEIQKKIFETFFTTKPKGKGTGLGLKIVQGLVAEHGGELRLSSEVGKGTIFTVSLRRNIKFMKQA